MKNLVEAIERDFGLRPDNTKDRVLAYIRTLKFYEKVGNSPDRFNFLESLGFDLATKEFIGSDDSIINWIYFNASCGWQVIIQKNWDSWTQVYESKIENSELESAFCRYRLARMKDVVKGFLQKNNKFKDLKDVVKGL